MSYNEGYGSSNSGYGQQGPPGSGYGGVGRDDNYQQQGGGSGGGGYGGGGYGGGGYGGGQASNYYGSSSNENQMPHSTGTSYGVPGGYNDNTDDYGSAAQHAQQHGGSSSDSGLFSTALGMLGGKGHKQKLQEEDLDEQGAVSDHQRLYGSGGGGGGGGVSSGSMGSAAAVQALKMFGGGGGGGHGGGSSGGGGQNQFVGMAMGQAAKLFDQQHANGNVQSGANKQDAVNSAAQMALKMYVKSQMGGGGGGGGGLMSLAGKFL